MTYREKILLTNDEEKIIKVQKIKKVELINYANEILAFSFFDDRLSFAQKLIENFDNNTNKKEEFQIVIEELKEIIDTTKNRDDSVKSALVFKKDLKSYQEIIVDKIRELEEKLEEFERERIISIIILMLI
ncbi:MAG: hypothetical protein mread185_000486 [Mycoplasmataceae bacterium]|nr:MAG: hypothetical protein mread185_000486 [Mycoplasmataceae bacterium]